MHTHIDEYTHKYKWHALYCLCVYVPNSYIYIYIYISHIAIFFYISEEQVVHMKPLKHVTFHCVFLKNKDTLLYNITIELRKLHSCCINL